MHRSRIASECGQCTPVVNVLNPCPRDSICIRNQVMRCSLLFDTLGVARIARQKKYRNDTVARIARRKKWRFLRVPWGSATGSS